MIGALMPASSPGNRTRETLTPRLARPLQNVKQLTGEEGEHLLPVSEIALAVQSNLAVLRCLEEQIETVERVVLQRVKLRAAFQPLLTVSGIGQILGIGSL